MSQRKAVTKTIATRYKRSNRGAKKIILDELCAITLWHRDHARKTAAQLLKIAPATIDRRLKAERGKLDPRGRSAYQARLTIEGFNSHAHLGRLG